MTTMAVTHPGFPRLPGVDAEVVRQLMRYGVVGALGTAVSTLLYLVFRIWWDAVPANLAALVLSTVLSTEVNRRFTFERCRRRPGPRVPAERRHGRVLRRLRLGRPAPARAGRGRADGAAGVARRRGRERRRGAGPVRTAAQLGVRRAGRARAAGVRHSGGVIRLRRLLVLLAALAGLLLATAGACDTGAAPAAPPATVAPTAESPDDSDDSDDSTADDSGDDEDGDGSGAEEPESEGPDDGAILRAGEHRREPLTGRAPGPPRGRDHDGAGTPETPRESVRSGPRMSRSGSAAERPRTSHSRANLYRLARNPRAAGRPRSTVPGRRASPPLREDRRRCSFAFACRAPPLRCSVAC